MLKNLLAIALFAMMASPALAMVDSSGRIQPGVYQVFSKNATDVKAILELTDHRLFQFDFWSDGEKSQLIFGRVDSIIKDPSSGDWVLTLTPLKPSEIAGKQTDGPVNVYGVEKIIVNYNRGLVFSSTAFIQMLMPKSRPDNKPYIRTHSGKVTELDY